MQLPLIGVLALLGRVLSLGFERPAFKALARDRDSVAATTLTYTLAVGLLLVALLAGIATGAEVWAGITAWWPLAVGSGVVAVVGYNLNMLALGRGEVSLLAPVYSSGLVWLYLLEVAIGGTQFHWLPLAGILLVVWGLTMFSAQTPLTRLLHPLAVLREPGALPMLISALLLGVTRVIDRQAMLGTASEVSYALVATLPVVGLSLLLLVLRGQGAEPLRLLRQRPGAAVGSAAAHTSGHLILLLAYQYFAASVVEPVGQLSVFVNIAIGALWFRESVQRRWLPAALIVAGACLVLATG